MEQLGRYGPRTSGGSPASDLNSSPDAQRRVERELRHSNRRGPQGVVRLPSSVEGSRRGHVARQISGRKFRRRSKPTPSRRPRDLEPPLQSGKQNRDETHRCLQPSRVRREWFTAEVWYSRGVDSREHMNRSMHVRKPNNSHADHAVELGATTRCLAERDDCFEDIAHSGPTVRRSWRDGSHRN